MLYFQYVPLTDKRSILIHFYHFMFENLIYFHVVHLVSIKFHQSPNKVSAVLKLTWAVRFSVWKRVIWEHMSQCQEPKSHFWGRVGMSCTVPASKACYICSYTWWHVQNGPCTWFNALLSLS